MPNLAHRIRLVNGGQSFGLGSFNFSSKKQGCIDLPMQPCFYFGYDAGDKTSRRGCAAQRCSAGCLCGRFPGQTLAGLFLLHQHDHPGGEQDAAGHAVDDVAAAAMAAGEGGEDVGQGEDEQIFYHGTSPCAAMGWNSLCIIYLRLPRLNGSGAD